MILIVLLSNLGYLATFAYILFIASRSGSSSADTTTWLLAIFFLFIAPVINLFYLLFLKKDTNWFGLYLKRKSLEEQVKINRLNKDTVC
jgi:hypothetical protein